LSEAGEGVGVLERGVWVGIWRWDGFPDLKEAAWGFLKGI